MRDKNTSSGSVMIPNINGNEGYSSLSLLFRDSNLKFENSKSTRIARIDENGNKAQTSCCWYHYCDEDEDVTMYVIIKNTSVMDVKDLNLFKSIEIKHCSDNKNIVFIIHANDNIIIQINILDDDNDIGIHINNDMYTFNLTQMENCCINVCNCFDCSTMFDVTNDDKIHPHGVTRIKFNQALNSSYPIGSINSTNSVTLDDDTIDYMKSINVNCSSLKDNSSDSISLIRIIFEDSSDYNCDLTCHINNGSYLNITPLCIVNVIFSIIIDIDLKNMQVSEFRNMMVMILKATASIRNEATNTTTQNGYVLSDTFSSRGLGWINGNNNTTENTIYDFVYHDYNTLLKNSHDKISGVETINNDMVFVLAVILHDYGLLVCLMISININSRDTIQFNDLINYDASNIQISVVYNGLIINISSLSTINIQTLYAVLDLESNDDGSNDTSSGALTISDTENLIHVQVKMIIYYITTVERKINHAEYVLSVLAEITEVSIEITLINAYYYDLSFITSSLGEEVGQLIFDTFENVVNMCIYSNEKTSVSIINGGELYILRMDGLITEANKIASNDYKNMCTNEYIKQQCELVSNVSGSSTSSDANNVILDYTVIITKVNLYVFLTLPTEKHAKKLAKEFLLIKIIPFELGAAESESLDNK